jgi:hypothetical protein
MTENKNLENIQSYPVLTSEVSTLPTRRVGAPGVSLGQTVQQALYETLGWRPRISDPKGFVAALIQSFTFVEVEGRKEWEWTPHVYTIQADLGAVTGAQASIYKRAKVFLDQSLPLLEGLKPLRADYDEEDTEASRAVVESYLTELVDELGLVGGPRVQLVDTHFLTLLGDIDVTTTNPEEVEGQLGVLRARFGLKRDLVNTIEEEQNLTNYLILVDYVLSLKRSWDAQRHFFDRSGTDVYLGTQLVLLSRAMGTLVESVYEAYDAMDSVFLGDAERQTLYLSLKGEETALTIAELLAWAERFGSEGGPRLIREGGKHGVRAFLPTVNRLRGLLRRAWEFSEESSNPVRGFHTPRVERTWEELTKHADFIYERAIEVAGPPPPSIHWVIPGSGLQGDMDVLVTIIGDNFQKEEVEEEEMVPVIEFGQGIKPVEGPIFHSDQLLTVKIKINDYATLGFRDVTVTNPDGQSDTKPNGFHVLELPEEELPGEPVKVEPTPKPPRIKSVKPSTADLSTWDGDMTVKGENLENVVYVVALARTGVAQGGGKVIPEVQSLNPIETADPIELLRSVLEFLGGGQVIRGKIESATKGLVKVKFDPEETDVGRWMVVVMDQYGQTARRTFDITGPPVKGEAASKE